MLGTVALIAAVMGLNALSVDIMLPALGLIARDLAVDGGNERQLVVIVFIVSVGVSQLLLGPLVDRYGRKPTLILSLGAYLAATLICTVVTSFPLLLAARALQGATTAVARVAVMAAARDRFHGSRLAQVMSLSLSVFMVVPIIAPALGQLVLMVGSWRLIFGVLLTCGVGLLLWSLLNFSESGGTDDSSNPGHRPAVSKGGYLNAYGTFLRNPVSVGQTVIGTLCMANVYAFVASAEQVFLETFAVGRAFPLFFAIVGLIVSAAALLNARLAAHIGVERLVRLALYASVVSLACLVALTLLQGDSLITYVVLLGVTFFCTGIVTPNSTSLALEPMPEAAGAAAALNGFATTAIAAVIGGFAAAAYDGGTLPIVCWLLALVTLATVVAMRLEKAHDA